MLPPVLVLQKSDGTDRCFAGAQFVPDKSCLEPGETLAIVISIDAQFLHGKHGRFLAETSVKLASESPLSLYLEVEV